MRILYIYQYFKTREGSGSTRCYEFAKQWVNGGHDVTVLTSDSHLGTLEPIKVNKLSNEYMIDGIHVIAVETSYSNYMNYIRRIWAFLLFMIKSSIEGVKRADYYQVVFASSTPLTVAIPAIILKKLKKVPFVFEVRDLWPEAPIQIGVIKSSLIKKTLKMLERKVYNEASHIIALSPGMVEGVIQEDIDKNKVTMVPNCSDLGLFEKQNHRNDEILTNYNLFDKFVVAHTGAIGITNGLDYIVNTAALLKDQKINDVVFLFVGDGKTKPLLEEKCRKLNLNNVIYTGRVAKKNMPEFLSISDITITSFKNIPILATNSPNKLFDSLAAGKPVIVNSNGWTKELVEKNKIGYYVDPKKPEELANVLIDVKDQSQLLEEMGQRARTLAEQEYDRVKLARKVENVLLDSARIKEDY